MFFEKQRARVVLKTEEYSKNEAGTTCVIDLKCGIDKPRTATARGREAELPGVVSIACFIIHPF